MKSYYFIGVIGAAILLLLVACSGQEVPTAASPSIPTSVPSATATPTPLPATPTPIPLTSTPDRLAGCPVDRGICSLAATLNQLVLTGDTSAIIARSQPTEFECPGPLPRGAGDPFPLCQGAEPGERRLGYLVLGLDSEGEVHSERTLQELLTRFITTDNASASDEFGSGATQMYSIGCPLAQQGRTISCREQSSVVFSKVQQQSSIRFQLMLYVRQPEGSDSPRIGGFVTGPLLRPGQLQTVLKGGSTTVTIPPGFSAFGTFHPWRPPERGR